MAEDKMMRLSQVARILNVGITTIVDHLSAKGFKVETNPNSKINSEQIGFLAKDFNSGELSAALAPAKHTPSPKVESPAENKPAPVAVESNITSKPSEPVKVDAPEVKSDASQTSEKPLSIENKLPGIKVVGQVELDKKGFVIPPKQPAREEVKEVKEVVQAKAEPVVTKVTEPAEPVVSPQPVKVVETAPVIEKPVAPEPVATKVVEETPAPKPVEVKPTPKPEAIANSPKSVNAPMEINKEKEKSKERKDYTSEKGQTPKKLEPTNAAAPTYADDQVIEAKSKVALKGLTVVGKIELPVEKSRKKDNDSNDSADKKRKRKRKRIRGENEPVKGSEQQNSNSNTNTNNQQQHSRGNNPNGNNNRPNKDNNQQGGNGGGGTNNSNNNSNDSRGNGPNKSKGGNNNNNNNNNSNPRNRREKREEVSQKEVSSNIKATMARMSGTNPKGGGGKGRNRKRDRNDDNSASAEEQETKILRVTEFVSANELSSLMDVSVQEVISVCLNMGLFVSINQRLDAEAISFIADEFGYEVEFISAEDELEEDFSEEEDNEADRVERAPIVTIMGHVDHGKTSLLDYIRKANVASGEAGGITQHIGAYSVKTQTGKLVTFLDTPGHEAFTAMRARGAQVTDVVIIVIASDDSIMPQTKEAINHAQVAGVPIVFAFSKIDKPGANSEKIREELAQMNLLVEDWGGKYQAQEISSKSGLGISDLLDKVLLEAELLELKANPKRRAAGTVIEASLDKGRGFVSTLLIQNGTMRVGDIVLAGAHFGRVKAMTDYRGNRLKEAGPATPVQLLGLNGAPQAGDKFTVMENERDAREIANKREQIQREQTMRTRKHITLEEIGRRKAIGTFKQLNLIVKGDVDGSVEALSDSLLQLSTEEVQVNIIHKAVGQISESDVNLAIASDAIIVGFQVRPSTNAKKMADQEQIEIRHYSVIYQAIDEIKIAMTGMLAPTVEEVVTGNIEVRNVFKISRVGTIAGCYVTDGFVKRNNKIRIIREGIVIHTGDIDSLKRFKDDVAEVRTGYECGLSIKNFNDIQEYDIIESFELKEVKRTL